MLLLLAALQAGGADLAEQVRREVARQECRGGAGEGDEVVVCGRRDARRRYQVTDPDAPFDPEGPIDSVAGERGRWIEELDTGIGSCSAIGPGGGTGCLLKKHRRERQQRKGQIG